MFRGVDEVISRSVGKIEEQEDKRGTSHVNCCSSHSRISVKHENPNRYPTASLIPLKLYTLFFRTLHKVNR